MPKLSRTLIALTLAATAAPSFARNGIVSPDGTPVLATPTPNAEDRITLFAQTIASTTATDALKSYDLTWLIHLVGDIHQPLHATTRFTADAPSGDEGGNLVSVSCSSSADCPSELHAVWDDVLGTKLRVALAGARLSYLIQQNLR